MTRQFVLRSGLSHTPNWLRNALDSRWLWHVVAYVGLGVVSIILWHDSNVTSATRARVSAEVAAKVADVKAAKVRTQADAAAAYGRCASSIPVLRKIDYFIDGEKAMARAAIENSAAVVDLTPPGSRTYVVRVANLRRLRLADAKVQAAPSFHVPTVKECLAAKAKILADGSTRPGTG